jgi:hypothetical protein
MIHDTTIDLYHALCAPEICGRDIVDESIGQGIKGATKYAIMFGLDIVTSAFASYSQKPITKTCVLMFMLHGELYA